MKADLAVVLAAGGSQRMGRPKALLDWGGTPLIRAHIDALSGWAREVVVVTGPVVLSEHLVDAIEISNPDWRSTWPSDSLRLALVARPRARVVLVTPVDVAPALPETVQLLMGRGDAVPVSPTGGDGHPVLLAKATTAAVREAAPDGGLRAILGDARRVVVADPLVNLDFDDEAAWQSVVRAAIGR